MVNVVPVADEREHVRDVHCWCAPRHYTFDPDTGRELRRGPVVVHAAADGREFSEQVTGECVTPGQQWAIVAD